MRDQTRGILFGLGGGLALSVAVPFLLPVVAAAARPVTKALIRQSVLGLDQLRTKLAHASEMLEDLMAEVQAELAEEQAAKQAFQVTAVSNASTASAHAEPSSTVDTTLAS
jgi:hypothetical protein